jgi:hypothetical protein
VYAGESESGRFRDAAPTKLTESSNGLKSRGLKPREAAPTKFIGERTGNTSFGEFCVGIVNGDGVLSPSKSFS